MFTVGERTFRVGECTFRIGEYTFTIGKHRFYRDKNDFVTLRQKHVNGLSQKRFKGSQCGGYFFCGLKDMATLK